MKLINRVNTAACGSFSACPRMCVSNVSDPLRTEDSAKVPLQRSPFHPGGGEEDGEGGEGGGVGGVGGAGGAGGADVKHVVNTSSSAMSPFQLEPLTPSNTKELAGTDAEARCQLLP